MSGRRAAQETQVPRVPAVTCRVVISLADSSRREEFFSRPSARGFTVFDAVDGRRGEGAELVDADAFRRQYGRDASPAEVAIAASHYRVIASFAAEPGDPRDLIVVAEDDALLADHAEAVVGRIARRALAPGIAVLAHGQSDAGYTHPSGISETSVQMSPFAAVVGRSGRHLLRIGHITGELWSAGLYTVSRDAARAMVRVVEKLGGIHWVADDWGYISQLTRTDLKLLRPGIAGWTGDSTFREVPAEVSRGTRVGLAERVRRDAAFRTRWRIARNSVAAGLRDLADAVEDGRLRR